MDVLRFCIFSIAKMLETYLKRPASYKLKYLWNVYDHQLTACGFTTSRCCLEALKCTETYGTQNINHHGCTNCTKFLNYKDEMIKYNL